MARARKPTFAKLNDGPAFEIGPIREVQYTRDDGQVVRVSWKRSGAPVMWWNKRDRILAWVDGSKPGRPRRLSADASAVAVRGYEQFHGREAAREREQGFTDGAFKRLGSGVFVAYRSNKFNGGGDGRWYTFEHELPASDTVWGQGKRGASLMAITGPRLTVNDRGIVY